MSKLLLLDSAVDIFQYFYNISREKSIEIIGYIVNTNYYIFTQVLL